MGVILTQKSVALIKGISKLINTNNVKRRSHCVQDRIKMLSALIHSVKQGPILKKISHFVLSLLDDYVTFFLFSKITYYDNYLN